MMDTGQTELAEMLQHIQPLDEVAFRIALFQVNGKWQVHTLVIEAFPKGSDDADQPLDYNYVTARFVTGVIRGATAAEWLSKREGRIQPPGASGPLHTFRLRQIGETINWYRYASYTRDDDGPFMWPHVRYDATGYTSQQTEFYDETRFLLSDDCPFFPNFKAAVLELIHQVQDWHSQPNLSAEPSVLVRIANTDAWLNHITVSPTAITVSISGTKVTGARLAITAPPDVHFEQQLLGRASIKCPLSDAIPSPLWIVLSGGNGWLDYYFRDERYPIFGRVPDNVTLDPGDIRTEIEQLISQGEGPEIEFKRQISGEDAKRFLRTVSAFANTVGGTILLGVDDRGMTHGVLGEVSDVKDTITRMLRDKFDPAPTFRIHHQERDGKPIIGVYIEVGTSHPCGVDPGDPHYYVRRGASNFPARPEELSAIVISRQPRSHLQYLNQG